MSGNESGFDDNGDDYPSTQSKGGDYSASSPHASHNDRVSRHKVFFFKYYFTFLLCLVQAVQLFLPLNCFPFRTGNVLFIYFK